MSQPIQIIGMGFKIWSKLYLMQFYQYITNNRLYLNQRMEAEQENIQPNRYSEDMELSELIRQNMDYQHQERIKNTLMKQSLVKLSLDKDFQHMYKLDASPNHNQQPQNPSNSIVEVCKQIKEICSWLEQSDDFKGMAYLPFASITKLLHVLHQKVENTVIVVTDYHSYWVQKMEDMNRLSMMKWAFLNTNLTKQEKVKVLQLYEMKKMKLLFISPSLFQHEEYLEFQCDILAVPDLHLFANSQQKLNKIVKKCSPGRMLGIYSSMIKSFNTYLNLDLSMINNPYSGQNVLSPTMIALKCQSQGQQKFKVLLSYLQKNPQLTKTLIIVNNKNQATNLSKKLKLKSLTSFNIHDYLSNEEISYFTPQQILNRPYKNSINGYLMEDRILETIYKSRNNNVTISKYFDGLRLANFDSIIFYDFVDVPKFINSCPDIRHRVILLADDDYFAFRNQITKDIFPIANLAKVVLRIMEKPRKKDENQRRRFFSEFVDSNALLSCYSVTKQAIKKNEEKVLRLNNFCRNYNVALKSLYQILDCMCSLDIVEKICKLTYEIEISDDCLMRFRQEYPQAVQIRSRVSILGLASQLKLTTNQILHELSSKNISYKITEQAIQLRIIKQYDEINFEELEALVNSPIMDKAKQFDDSYLTYRDLSYSSVQLTRRQKFLNRWKVLVQFYETKHQTNSINNIFESYHKSNLLTSQIQEWIRNQSDQINLDQHELIMLLQGVLNKKLLKFKEDPISGRYRRIRYQNLSRAIEKIYRNKRVKIE